MCKTILLTQNIPECRINESGVETHSHDSIGLVTEGEKIQAEC